MASIRMGRKAAPRRSSKTTAEPSPQSDPRPSTPLAADRFSQAPREKPSIGVPDPLLVAQEEARHAKEGSAKLQRAVEVLREGLETITVAEWDRVERREVTANELRKMAAKTLGEYSALTGQNWKRHRIVHSHAGGTGNPPVHEGNMTEAQE